MPEHDDNPPEPTSADDQEHDFQRPSRVLPDESPPPDSPPWDRMEVIADGDLMDAIDTALGGLGDDDLSSGEAQRVSRLRHLLDSPWKRRKRQLRGSEEMIGRLASLRERCPNFTAVTEHVIRMAQLSAATQTPLALPPLLLLGDPGTGKSHYSRQIAAALGSEVTAIAGSTMVDGGNLTGLNASWRGARPGRIASALIEGRTSSPVILLDEIDKVAPVGLDRPLDALLGLLEPSDARHFQDDFFGVPMRADGIIWICTANDIAPLSAPLRDRLLTIRVPPLSPAQRDRIAKQIFGELNALHGGRFTLAIDALAPAQGLTTRRLKAVLGASFGYAVAASRRTVTAADIAAARTLVAPDPTAPTRIGFDLGRHHD